MKNSTTSMQQSTKELQSSTQEVSKATNEVADNVSNTYFDLRQGDSLGHRADVIEKMSKEPRIEGKIEDAGIYIMAFEFQLWKNQREDNLDKRLGLFADATNEFMMRIRSYIPSNHDMNVTSTDSSMENLYAIAIALDQINPTQVRAAAKSGFQTVSLLTLLQTSLAKKADLNSGIPTDMPEYVLNVLKSEDAAVYLLQTRYNFIYAMVLDQLSHISEANLLVKGWSYMFGMEVDPSAMNLVQLHDLNQWLQKAKEERTFLVKAGQHTPLDSTIENFYAKLSVKKPDLSANNLSPVQAQEMQNLVKNLESVTKN